MHCRGSLETRISVCSHVQHTWMERTHCVLVGARVWLNCLADTWISLTISASACIALLNRLVLHPRILMHQSSTYRLLTGLHTAWEVYLLYPHTRLLGEPRVWSLRVARKLGLNLRLMFTRPIPPGRILTKQNLQLVWKGLENVIGGLQNQERNPQSLALIKSHILISWSKVWFYFGVGFYLQPWKECLYSSSIDSLPSYANIKQRIFLIY